MLPAFQPGDVVKLKSGGPQMTVERWDEERRAYCCIWFQGATKKRGYFAEPVLKNWSVDNPARSAFLVKTQPAQQAITPSELLQAFRQDEIDAERRYLNKIIRICGRIAEVSTRRGYVSFGGDPEVCCWGFTGGLPHGQVTIEGRVSRHYKHGVRLDECRVINPEKTAG